MFRVSDPDWRGCNAETRELLLRDGAGPGDAPWIHACGEDDDGGEIGAIELLLRDGAASGNAPWIHACGEDDDRREGAAPGDAPWIHAWGEDDDGRVPDADMTAPSNSDMIILELYPDLLELLPESLRNA